MAWIGISIPEREAQLPTVAGLDFAATAGFGAHSILPARSLTYVLRYLQGCRGG